MWWSCRGEMSRSGGADVRRNLTVLGLAVLMVLTVPGVLRVLGAQGQQPTPGQQPTFRSSVDLVHVDVVVVDRDGQPVRDLPQNAFTVKDRGKTQSIATFQEIGHDVQAA